MKPTMFKYAEAISEPPEDTPGVAVPYVCIGEYFIMCERASLLERLLILITGRIYISVIPDKIVPPISCTTIFPFKALTLPTAKPGDSRFNHHRLHLRGLTRCPRAYRFGRVPPYRMY